MTHPHMPGVPMERKSREGQSSQRKKNHRFVLVRAGKASWYCPYKPLDQALHALD